MILLWSICDLNYPTSSGKIVAYRREKLCAGCTKIIDQEIELFRHYCFMIFNYWWLINIKPYPSVDLSGLKLLDWWYLNFNKVSEWVECVWCQQFEVKSKTRMQTEIPWKMVDSLVMVESTEDLRLRVYSCPEQVEVSKVLRHLELSVYFSIIVS